MPKEPTPPTEAEVTALGARVLAYLERHPKAADTWEGIASWWLQVEPSVQPEAIRAALDRLVAAGSLAARRLPSAQWLYSAAPGRTAVRESRKLNPTGRTGNDEDGNPRRE